MTIKILSNHEHIQKQSKRLQQEVGGWWLPNWTIRIANISLDEDTDGFYLDYVYMTQTTTNLVWIVFATKDVDWYSKDVWLGIHNRDKTTNTINTNIYIRWWYIPDEAYVDWDIIHFNYFEDSDTWENHVDYTISTNSFSSEISWYDTWWVELSYWATVERNNKVWSSIAEYEWTWSYEARIPLLVWSDPV